MLEVVFVPFGVSAVAFVTTDNILRRFKTLNHFVTEKNVLALSIINLIHNMRDGTVFEWVHFLVFTRPVFVAGEWRKYLFATG